MEGSQQGDGDEQNVGGSAAPAANEDGAAEEPEEEAVRQRLAELVQGALMMGAGPGPGSGGGAGGGFGRGQAGKVQHRLFAVTMLCMEEEWEAHAADLLWAAFEAFPGKVGG